MVFLFINLKGMKMTNKKVVLIRGFNTSGDDLKIGPIDYGDIYSPLKKAFKSKKFEVECLYNLGQKSLEDQTNKAIPLINKMNNSEGVHLFCHSSGGILARQIIADSRLKTKVKSLITVGSPHKGFEFVRLLVERKLFQSVASKAMGELPLDFLKQLLPEHMEEFNKKYPPPKEINAGHLMANCSKKQISPFLKAIHKLTHRKQEKKSDGFISCKSQEWNECFGSIQLDHFGQIGFFPLLTKKKKIKAKNEFQRYIDLSCEIFLNS